MAIHIRRRKLIAALGGAATWPLAARSQQSPALPLIGILSALSSATAERNIDRFAQGCATSAMWGVATLSSTSVCDGVNERLPDLAAELAALKPAVIIAGGPQAALVVHNATQTIPIVINPSEIR